MAPPSAFRRLGAQVAPGDATMPDQPANTLFPRELPPAKRGPERLATPQEVQSLLSPPARKTAAGTEASSVVPSTLGLSSPAPCAETKAEKRAAHGVTVEGTAAPAAKSVPAEAPKATQEQRTQQNTAPAPPETKAEESRAEIEAQIASLKQAEQRLKREMEQATAEQQAAAPSKKTEPKPQATVPAPAPAPTTGASWLLDLAEILDQHKVWVESAGEAGTRADLCGVNLERADLTGVNLQGAFLHKANLRGADLSLANLRGASLVQADLRETNLLGTELRGANLMGATLYGAEGLWVGRLGGTNLFDTLLPESLATFDGPKAVAQATKVARWFYFLMLTVCAVCWVLIALTTDQRLLDNASAIPFPRSENLLPMSGLYLGGPLVLLVLYLRLHFLLLRLWGNMAALPAVFVDGQTLEKDGPWYLMGLVRKHFRWLRDTRSPMIAMETGLSAFFAYWAVPITIFLFWLRYLVLQDFRGTLLHIAVLGVCVAIATTIPVVVSRMLRPGELWKKQTKGMFRVALANLRPTLLLCGALLALALGVMHGVPADRAIAREVGPTDARRWASDVFQLAGYRPFLDVTEATLSSRPLDNDWSAESVAKVDGAKLNQMNLRYARAYHAFLANGRLWRSNLEGADLSEADLRGANMREAILRNVTMDRAVVSKAILVSADLSGANLAFADLRGADLSYGNLETADLSNAKLSGASFYAAMLRETRFLRADLSRSDLRDVHIERAVLARAVLELTDFSSAKMANVDLTGAQLRGTILLDADLKNADLRGAYFGGTILRGAQLEGAKLGGADLRTAVGLSPAQLCGTVNWRGAQLDPDFRAQTEAQCAPGKDSD